jgi:hypothetical protein
LTEFQGLEYRTLLILHVSKQNSGLLIRRHQEYDPLSCLTAVHCSVES